MGIPAGHVPDGGSLLQVRVVVPLSHDAVLARVHVGRKVGSRLQAELWDRFLHPYALGELRGGHDDVTSAGQKHDPLHPAIRVGECRAR
jgi:hypothetical protein